MQIFNPNQPPIGPFKPPPSGGNTGNKNPGTAGLLTSTGGLFGINGYLLTPIFNTVTQGSYIMIMDPTNFDCEEFREYDFPQEIPPRDSPQEGRNVTIHLAILKYRELGKATFNLNITTYQKTIDDFITVSIPVNIPAIPLTGNRLKTFPDKRIHTQYISIDIVGERPQAFLTSNPNSGPHSITSLTLCGNADELPQV